ncbi:MAG: YqgE/AlgH family protein [Holosporales bacterium]|jgi:putative transcriptional regulator|nr:YqgE/AlgH family protein [Holosporales bacterium]
MKTISPYYNFAGKLLIAMPHVRTPRFAQTVMFVCEHNEKGSTGIILNRLESKIQFDDLLLHVGLTRKQTLKNACIYHGGSTDMDKGFILHTADFLTQESIPIGENFALTKTIGILKSIVSDGIPQYYWIAMGYTYWPIGQLEYDFQENEWLCMEPNIELMFSTDVRTKWQRAFSVFNIVPERLSAFCGNA